MKKRILALIMITALGVSFVACGSNTKSEDTTQDVIETSAETDQPEVETETELPETDPIVEETTLLETEEPTNVETEATETIELTSDYISDIIDGQIGSKETITDVLIENSVITITVDITNSPSEDLALLAESRTSSITDSLLDDESFMKFFEVITLNFEGIGKISFTPDDIIESSYGNYFEVPVDYFK